MNIGLAHSAGPAETFQAMRVLAPEGFSLGRRAKELGIWEAFNRA